MRVKASFQGCVLGLAVTHGLAQTLTADMIENMGNNSLFTRWRPISRIQAPAGWMNDPCGPMYDPATGLYHMHYQWHPNHANWGNISWGHATSSDFITWTDVDHRPGADGEAWQNDLAQSIGTTNLTTDHHDPAKYNFLGIFSGTAQPINITGEDDGTMLAFYTSVSRLPFSWDQTYPTGAETQSLAYSYDGGVTWEQYADNPVLSTPPAGWNITGWRDPFFLAFTELDTLLEYDEPHYYVIFGAGINGTGPRAPLYSAPKSNLANWTFLGALYEPGKNVSLGDIAQTGTWGQQWEVPNFFNIDDHWYVSSGIQGGISTYRSFWNLGNITARENRSVLYTPQAGGNPDWGNLYAITSFVDSKNNDRRIQIGWSIDENNGFGFSQIGYQGSLSLPKELFNLYTPNVEPPSTPEVGNSLYIEQANGTYSALTLGAKPLADVIDGLRNGSTYTNFNMTSLTGNGNATNTQILANNSARSYELSLAITSTSGITGVTVASSPDFEEFTTISYDPSTYTISCERLYSSLIYQFSNTTYSGYFAPYSLTNSLTSNSDTTHSQPESVRMRVFIDGSLFEITVNDRFWMTGRIYPSREDSTGVGLWAAEGVQVTYKSVEMWDGLLDVWPDRPDNSSSVQLFDTPAETNNYTWWQGN